VSGWQAHGTCWHGHVTEKVRGTWDGEAFVPSPDGAWTRELAPEACGACTPGKVLSTYVQHPAPHREVPAAAIAPATVSPLELAQERQKTYGAPGRDLTSESLSGGDLEDKLDRLLAPAKKRSRRGRRS
jgi:hypothetical protein